LGKVATPGAQKSQHSNYDEPNYNYPCNCRANQKSSGFPPGGRLGGQRLAISGSRRCTGNGYTRHSGDRSKRVLSEVRIFLGFFQRLCKLGGAAISDIRFGRQGAEHDAVEAGGYLGVNLTWRANRLAGAFGEDCKGSGRLVGHRAG
jgi:hypothetical protein